MGFRNDESKEVLLTLNDAAKRNEAKVIGICLDPSPKKCTTIY